MAVKVLVTRQFKGDKMRDAYALVTQLRSKAILRHGHISGETLVSEDTLNRVVVVSTWASRKDWEDWRATPMRRDFMRKIGECLASPEQVEVFQIGEKDPEWVHMA